MPRNDNSAGILPVDLLTQPIPDTAPNAAQLRRGQYLVAAGDCMSCHLREGGEPFAGGLGLNTPFGVIYTPNITSDQETGIGAWTTDQFYHAMHDGNDDEGSNLYPAFPYPWFRLVSREDDDAIFAFLEDHAGGQLHAAEQRSALPAQSLHGEGLESAVPELE